MACGSVQWTEVRAGEKKDGHWKANTDAKQVFLMKIFFCYFFSPAFRYQHSTSTLSTDFNPFFFLLSRQFVTYSFTSMKNIFNGRRINASEEWKKLLLCDFSSSRWANNDYSTFLPARSLVHSFNALLFFVLIKIFQTFANSELLSTENSFKIAQCRTKFGKLIALFDTSVSSVVVSDLLHFIIHLFLIHFNYCKYCNRKFNSRRCFNFWIIILVKMYVCVSSSSLLDFKAI